MATWPACPRSQDGRRFPQGQRRCHPQGVRALCRALPRDGSACESERCHRWQQVQGGEQPRQELHAREDGAAPGTARGECRALSEPARYRRSAGTNGSARREDHASQGEARQDQRADGAPQGA